MTFWPQDFHLLAWLLIIAAFALFTVTVFAGRVWCGYTCPQTVWTSIFMWMEQRAEGSRNQRVKLDKQPWSAGKLSKKLYKHGMWLGFGLLTGLTFIGYFYPIRELIVDLVHLQANMWAVPDSTTEIFSCIFPSESLSRNAWARFSMIGM